jgi:hypothetical protein
VQIAKRNQKGTRKKTDRIYIQAQRPRKKSLEKLSESIRVARRKEVESGPAAAFLSDIGHHAAARSSSLPLTDSADHPELLVASANHKRRWRNDG